MKFLRNILDSIAPHVEKGAKCEKLYPFYEVVDTFFYTPKDTTQGSVHVRDSMDLKRMMSVVCIALIPCALMAMYNTGLQANRIMEIAGLTEIPGWRGSIMALLIKFLPFLSFDPNCIISCFVHGALYFLPAYIVCMIVGCGIEIASCCIRGHEMSEGFFVTGLLIPLTLPPTIPLWQVAIGTAFGVIFAVEVFGGTGRNFLNPALTARAYLFFAHATSMSGGANVWTAVDWGQVKAANLSASALDAVSQATPLSIAMQSDGGGTRGLQEAGVSFLNTFIGLRPGSMGETSILACLIGMAILLFCGVASWRIMLSMTAGALALATLFWYIGSETNTAFALAPHWHLILGGFAFGAIFMATDPISASMTKGGQYVYGALIGVLVIVVRVLNPGFPEGVMLAILLGNVCAPTIDYYFVKANIARRAARVAA